MGDVKHTPGPWIEQHGGNITLPDRPDCPPIAWVGGFSPKPHREARANARLIAAAPDLLFTVGLLLRTIAVLKGYCDVPLTVVRAAGREGDAEKLLAKIARE